jgi:hypothetical protein
MFIRDVHYEVLKLAEWSLSAEALELIDCSFKVLKSRLILEGFKVKSIHDLEGDKVEDMTGTAETMFRGQEVKLFCEEVDTRIVV